MHDPACAYGGQKTTADAAADARYGVREHRLHPTGAAGNDAVAYISYYAKRAHLAHTCDVSGNCHCTDTSHGPPARKLCIALSRLPRLDTNSSILANSVQFICTCLNRFIMLSDIGEINYNDLINLS